MMDMYKKIVDRLKGSGLTISKHILDNEASAEFKKFIKDNGMEYKLVPLGGIEETLPKEQSKEPKFISLQSCAASVPASPCTCGAGCCYRQNTH